VVTGPHAVRLRVSEVFTSIQGEGPTVGTPSVFVRLQGCTVGCAWCDTKYSWNPAAGEETTLDALLATVQASPAQNVVVTGGEPLEHPAFVDLVTALHGIGSRIEVETSGIIEPPPVPVDQWNVSLKLAHSRVPDDVRLRPRVIARLRDLGAWFKFVVADEADVDEVLAIQAAHELPAARVLLMPLGMERREQEERMPSVIEWCRRHGFRFSPRLHILVWGPKRGV
jgi:7-carboxy-7-deazaguanine synthase